MELASTISSEFQRDQSDGLLGLAFSSINTVSPDKQKTFFTNAEGSLNSPLFAVDLKKGQPGYASHLLLGLLACRKGS